MSQDTLQHIAEKICQLWTECGGGGPPHAFKVGLWRDGAEGIQDMFKLSQQQWMMAHHLAVKLGAARRIGTA